MRALSLVAPPLHGLPMHPGPQAVHALVAAAYGGTGAVAERMFLSVKTIEANVTSILLRLDLGEGPEGNRRVLAVLRYLCGPQTG